MPHLDVLTCYQADRGGNVLDLLWRSRGCDNEPLSCVAGYRDGCSCFYVSAELF
ncbi:hypothetical protein SXCC_01995 [Gluconacetobacter sp. SXCC-1]|nr:hypothetical protein SXCC_01995 [Gluconacetobacter sp. SXCC-1]